MGSWEMFLVTSAIKWVVLFSYPLDFTFVCPTEITQYSDRFAEFDKLNCAVLSWSMQERKQGGLGKMNIPLIADVTKNISRDYGVLINDGPDAGVALRSIFLIDPNQNVRQITINDLPVGRNVDETLRLLQAFQYHEKTGEVVPCNWKPGSATMKADPKQSQEYFKNNA